MRRVVQVEAKSDFILSLCFDDGTRGEVSIKDRLFGPMFEPLQDPDYFKRVTVDEYGAICWPNNADLAPDALYALVQKGAK